MKGYQKFLTKIVCVLVIFGGVVGESERAEAVGYPLDTALELNGCTGGCISKFYEYVTSNTIIAQELFSLLRAGNLAGANTLIRTIITVIGQTLSASGVSSGGVSGGDKNSSNHTNYDQLTFTVSN